MRTIDKWQTSCCALCQFTASNETTKEELEYRLEKQKHESLSKEWKTNDRMSGERAIFTITTPYEKPLEILLEDAGFKHITTFNRRKGYPEGTLKMWIYKF